MVIRSALPLIDCDDTIGHTELPACRIAHGIAEEWYKMKSDVSLDSVVSKKAFLKELPGKTISDYLKILAKRGGFNFSELELHQIATEEDEKIISEFSKVGTVEIAPGIVDVLNDFKESGFPLIIVSNSSKKRVVATLTGLGLLDIFFTSENIFSARECSGTKPDPAVYNLVKSKFDEYDYYVAFEDSSSGVRAAGRSSQNGDTGLIIYTGAHESPRESGNMLSAIAREENIKSQVLDRFSVQAVRNAINCIFG